MNVIYIVSDIFIAAMAVFGLWCVFQFLLLDLTARDSLRCAVDITSKEQIAKLEAVVCEIDRSAFLAREEKYAMLIDKELLYSEDISALPESISDRVEFYVRVQK